MADNNLDKNSSVMNMTFMDDVQYFKDRLDAQLEYLNNKASDSKKKYKFYKRVEFILAASIPVVIGLSAMGVAEGAVLFHIKGIIGMQAVKIPFTLSILLQILAALSGIILAFINKIIELDEYYKSWKDFRLTHELLYNQKIMYLTKSEPYTSDNAFKILIQNVESILTKEVQKWSIQKTEDNKLTQNALASLEKMFNKKAESSVTASLISETSTETVVEENAESTVTKTTETSKETVTDISTTPVEKVAITEEKKGTEIDIKTEDEDVKG